MSWLLLKSYVGPTSFGLSGSIDRGSYGCPGSVRVVGLATCVWVRLVQVVGFMMLVLWGKGFQG